MKLEQLIDSLPEEEQEILFAKAQEYKDSLKREKAQKDFMAFVRQMWPGFINGGHHKIMAQKFQDIADGKLR